MSVASDSAVAATYSPGCDSSTIGVAGLNGSVRNGKRWTPAPWPPSLLFPHAYPALASRRWVKGMAPLMSLAFLAALETTTATLRVCRRHFLACKEWSHAFGPLVRLGSSALTPCTCRLSTSWSRTTLHGSLIFGPASHLDAFSAYQFPT